MSEVPFSRDFKNFFLARMGYKYVDSKPVTSGLNSGILMDRIWSNYYSATLTKRINFSVIVKLALDLNITLEDIIYGTNNSKEIAQFNFDNYEDLVKIHKFYLNENFKKTLSFTYYFKKLHTYKSLAELGRLLGLSRTTIANYANENLKVKGILPRKRSVIEGMASELGKEPYEIIEVPANILLKDEDFLKEYRSEDIETNVSALKELQK